MYCLKFCQVAEYKNYRAPCDIIHTLKNQVRDEIFRHINCCYNQCITPVNSLKLAKFVGNCPVLNYTLNNKSYETKYSRIDQVKYVEDSL